MKKYVISFDLDDTLLNHDSELSEKTIKLVKDFTKDGHLVVINTGRPYLSCINFYNQLSLNTPLITDNGATISFPKTEIKPLEKLIPLNVMKSLFQKTGSFLETVFFNVGSDVYLKGELGNFSFLLKDVSDDNIKSFDYDEITFETGGMIISIIEENKSKFDQEMKSFKNVLGYRSWGNYHGYIVYEVYLSSINKYTAIKYVTTDVFMMPVENIISIGDGVNDYEMIKHSAIGVAMKNGVKENFLVADEISSFDNNESGAALAVSEILTKVIQIK